jgi:hypothetical protein
VRINRLALGFVAGPIALATGLALAYWEIRLFGIIHWKLIPLLALASGCCVFWLADRLGVLEEPPSPKSFLLTDEDSESRAAGADSKPIVPR